MLTRITIMFVVIAVLCSAAFTLGGKAVASQSDASGIPPEHPVALALRFQQELGLSSEQVAKLDQSREAMAKEFAPLRERAQSIQHRMQELQQSGKSDEDAAKKLQHEGEELGAKIQPLFERYSQSVVQLLSPEQREKLMKLSEAHAHGPEGRGFVMMFVMQSREQLGISPQQFTKLQYLQADFIRAFAPLREQMETLQMEVQEQFGRAGKEPTREYRERAEGLQKKIGELQAQFSERAIKDVLQPNQRAKLVELLHGEHRSAPNRG